MLNPNPTHSDVTNMLRDQGPASIEVDDANKEASGKAVYLGPAVMGDTKERSLRLGEWEQKNTNNFREGG